MNIARPIFQPLIRRSMRAVTDSSGKQAPANYLLRIGGEQVIRINGQQVKTRNPAN